MAAPGAKWRQPGRRGQCPEFADERQGAANGALIRTAAKYEDGPGSGAYGPVQIGSVVRSYAFWRESSDVPRAMGPRRPGRLRPRFGMPALAALRTARISSRI